jgi:hypothetical protein
VDGLGRAAALVGRQLVDDRGRVLTVTGAASWSPNYVELESEDGFRTVRNIALLELRFAR